MIIGVEFREHLLQAMEKRGVIAADLARQSRIPPSHISAILTGKIDNPTLDTLRPIADALEMSLDELTGGAPRSADHDEPREERVIMLPIVGAAPGGATEEAIQFGDEIYGVLRHLVKENRFVIKLTGDSMFSTYWPGDLLLVERTTKVADGDIALVRIGTESTVKRVRVVRGKVASLIADNPTFHPRERLILAGEDVRIEGRVLRIVEGKRP